MALVACADGPLMLTAGLVLAGTSGVGVGPLLRRGGPHARPAPARTGHGGDRHRHRLRRGPRGATDTGRPAALAPRLARLRRRGAPRPRSPTPASCRAATAHTRQRTAPTPPRGSHPRDQAWPGSPDATRPPQRSPPTPTPCPATATHTPRRTAPTPPHGSQPPGQAWPGPDATRPPQRSPPTPTPCPATATHTPRRTAPTPPHGSPPRPGLARLARRHATAAALPTNAHSLPGNGHAHPTTDRAHTTARQPRPPTRPGPARPTPRDRRSAPHQRPLPARQRCHATPRRTAPPTTARQPTPRPGLGWLARRPALPLYTTAFSYGLVGAVYWAFAAEAVSDHAGTSSAATAPLFWTLIGLAGTLGVLTGPAIARFGLRRVHRGLFAGLAAAAALLTATHLSGVSLPAALLSALLYGPCFMAGFRPPRRV